MMATIEHLVCRLPIGRRAGALCEYRTMALRLLIKLSWNILNSLGGEQVDLHGMHRDEAVAKLRFHHEHVGALAGGYAGGLRLEVVTGEHLWHQPRLNPFSNHDGSARCVGDLPIHTSGICSGSTKIYGDMPLRSCSCFGPTMSMRFQFVASAVEPRWASAGETGHPRRWLVAALFRVGQEQRAGGTQAAAGGGELRGGGGPPALASPREPGRGHGPGATQASCLCNV